jgi:hypothetical protein
VEDDMLCAMLIYENPTDFTRRDPSVENDAYAGAWREYHQALLKAGVFVTGHPLDVPPAGKTIRVRDNARQVQDGPYASTKEQLGGFTILDVPSFDAAMEWAARCPAASYGAVEVRALAGGLERRITDE